MCYIDCPVGFRENAQACLIPTIRRKLTPLICPPLFVISGDSCTASATLLWLTSIFSIFLAFMYYGGAIYATEKNIKSFQT